jgi:hypothetical protein
MICGLVPSVEVDDPNTYVQTHLDDELPNVKEEISNTIVVFVLMKDEKFEV